MRTGDTRPRIRQAGFTYLWLIFVIAIGGATLAALGQRWSTVAQREREAELLFRGEQIAAAIASYRMASPDRPALPLTLEDLVEDRRGPRVRHHLRKLYDDPFTGLPDWVLIVDAKGGIRGVHSRSLLPAFKAAGMPPAREGRPVRLADHVFMAAGALAEAPANPASADAPMEGE